MGDFDISLKMTSVTIKNHNAWDIEHAEQFGNEAAHPSKRIKSKNSTGDENERPESLVLNRKVKITGYCLNSFHELRLSDGLTPDLLQKSLNPENNTDSVFKAGEASGASGSFFFFSHDKLFIIKTMTDTELNFFKKKFAKAYFEHLFDNPGSLIARMYGVYTVKIGNKVPVNLMLMAHTLQVKSNETIERIFDIKGSTVKRKVKFSNSTKNTATLKDVNLSEMTAKK